MRTKIELEQILNEISGDLDKSYFKVSAKRRDTIARLVMLKDLWDTQPFDRDLVIYKEYITMKINFFEDYENYEAADFYKRIKKQINNIKHSQHYI
jgi:hypothetical protein